MRGAGDARMTRPLWTPSPARVASSNLAAFMARVRAEWSEPVHDYAALHAFSVAAPEKFWASVWDHCGIVASQRGLVVVEHAERLPGARWFPQARLNFAENLLRRRDEAEALVHLREEGPPVRMSFRTLFDAVSRLAQALSAAGVVPGSRVAACLPNAPEAMIAMLATTSLGAVWCACSPEFGVEATLDRIAQVDPAVLFLCEGYRYGGKEYDTRGKARDIAARIAGSRVNVVVGARSGPVDASGIRAGVAWDAFLAPFAARDIAFVQLPFDHPAFILFSSGTSGKPKCIVHGAGGALLENLKGHVLQFDVRADDRVFWWTSTGWVVWNIMGVALAAGATLLLYDGSPFHPAPAVLWDHAAREKVTFLRLTPKYIDTIAQAGLAPRDTHDLASLRCISVGGSPFGADGFVYLYDKVKPDLQVASPAGGTDPFAALVSGHPTAPVWPGEIQCAALGIAVNVFGDDGRRVEEGAGELVCTQSFPSLPLGLWDDPGGERFRASYFSRFPGVWSQGDWASKTPHGGFVIHGRSDATLKVRGIRIGTAEIYRPLARVAGIAECAAIAWQDGSEEKIVLLLQMHAATRLDAALADRIRRELREHASPRHVPDAIVEVADLPRTTTGKVSEAAIAAALQGRKVANRESLANPQALDLLSAALFAAAL